MAPNHGALRAPPPPSQKENTVRVLIPKVILFGFRRVTTLFENHKLHPFYWRRLANSPEEYNHLLIPTVARASKLGGFRQFLEQTEADWSLAGTHFHGDHLLHCERGIHRIRRHDVQFRLLEADLIKSPRRPVVEPRLFGRYKERPDISASGSRGGSDMFDITFFHPLSPARVRDGMENALNLLKKAWDEKIWRFGRVLHESATSVKLFSIPPSTLGGWQPDSYRAMTSIAVKIASRTLDFLEYASQTLFQRHAALLVANTAVCLISGFVLRI